MAERNPTVRSGRRLPTGRAVLGGLLISLAVLSMLAAMQYGRDSNLREVVVARRDLAPGTILGPDDVALVSLRIDPGVSFLLEDPEQVYGSVLLGPVSRLEFVQVSNLAGPTATAGGLAQVSVAVEPSRAPAQLSPGELVSILTTYDGTDAEGSVTRLVADRVVVLSYRPDDDFGGRAVLRLGLDDGATAARIVNAAQSGELSIIGIMSAPDLILPSEVGT